MGKRFVSIWFRHLRTDWFSLRRPELRNMPVVLRQLSHGRYFISAVNCVAEQKGISCGMILADARVLFTDLTVLDDRADLPSKLLHKLAEWCIRFTPRVAIDLPDGLILDAEGCSHLWKGDIRYVDEIVRRLTARGYDVRVAMADTAGAAWACARYSGVNLIMPPAEHMQAISSLPPEALRLSDDTILRLHKLGLHRIAQLIKMPRASLRRRFGSEMLQQLDQLIGQQMEVHTFINPPEPWQERLHCLEPIITAAGIEIALQKLLEILCNRLRQNLLGIRTAVFKCYRLDGKVEEIRISTHRPSIHIDHLFDLFSHKIPTIAPDLGIELFVLDAIVTEEHLPQQENMWEQSSGLSDSRLSELIDRIASHVGARTISRYLPSEHYWPERSIRSAIKLEELPDTSWPTSQPRPVRLLYPPEKIVVSAPIPDYPPMLFRYQNKVHKILRADGPERIEQEWWIQQGQHRDYYRVEDEEGQRYWLFRSGHYDDKTFQWFLHGFFA